MDSDAGRKGERDGLNAIQDLVMEAESLQINVFGDFGVATFILHSQFRASAGPAERREQGSLVFVRNLGEWKIVHEHFAAFKPSP